MDRDSFAPGQRPLLDKRPSGWTWMETLHAGGMCGKGHAWQGGVCGGGACMVGGVCGGGRVWQEETATAVRILLECIPVVLLLLFSRA